MPELAAQPASYWAKRAKSLNKRARKSNALGKVTGGQLFFLFKNSRWRCAACGSGDDLTVDHVRPLIRGGVNSVKNMQILCFSCNQNKADDKPGSYRK